MNTRARGLFSTLIHRALPQALLAQREIRVLQSWWSSPRSERAARAVEARLFFDPPLLDAALRAQRLQRQRRQGRVLAMLLLGVAAAAAPLGTAQAAEPMAGDAAGPAGAGDDGRSIWDWLIDAVTMGGDEGDGSVDPETGDPNS
jgi:hypothetical protein